MRLLGERGIRVSSFLLQKYGLWSQSRALRRYMRRYMRRSQLSQPSRPSFSSRSNNNNHSLFAYITPLSLSLPLPYTLGERFELNSRCCMQPRHSPRREWRVGREIAGIREIDGDVTNMKRGQKRLRAI